MNPLLQQTLLNAASSPTVNLSPPADAPPLSEAPTIIPSPADDNDGDDINGNIAGTTIMSSTVQQQHQNQFTTSSTQAHSLSLDEQIPKVADVLQEVKKSPHIKQLFANSQFYTKEEDQAIFFAADCWKYP